MMRITASAPSPKDVADFVWKDCGERCFRILGTPYLMTSRTKDSLWLLCPCGGKLLGILVFFGPLCLGGASSLHQKRPWEAETSYGT